MSDATTTPERPFFGQPFGWLVLAVALALVPLVAALVNAGWPWVRLHPALNAVLNGSSAVFLIAGGIAIKQRKLAFHRQAMLAAVSCSAVFLASYLVRFATTGALLGLALLAGSLLPGGAAHAADNGFYLGAGFTQAKIDDIGPSIDFEDDSFKLIAGFRPLDAFGVEFNYIDLGKDGATLGPIGVEVDGKAYAAYAVGSCRCRSSTSMPRPASHAGNRTPVPPASRSTISTTRAPSSPTAPASRPGSAASPRDSSPHASTSPTPMAQN